MGASIHDKLNIIGKNDIDIAVDITGPMELSFVAMANEFEDLFGIKVNIVCPLFM